MLRGIISYSVSPIYKILLIATVLFSLSASDNSFQSVLKKPSKDSGLSSSSRSNHDMALKLPDVSSFSASPTATQAYIMAKEDGGDPDFAVAAISTSTIFSSVTYGLWLTMA